MHKTIISDTSCFIVLETIGEMNLLKETYGTVITTPEVAAEFGLFLPSFVEIQSPSDRKRQRDLELQVDKGEASAMALALEIAESTVILDDFKARKVAEKLGLDITGTVGVIIKAKKSGIIPSIKPYLEKLRTTNFRLGTQLEKEALLEAGE